MTKLSRAHTKSISFKTSSSLRLTESGGEFDDINSMVWKNMPQKGIAEINYLRFVYPPIIWPNELCK